MGKRLVMDAVPCVKGVGKEKSTGIILCLLEWVPKAGLWRSGGSCFAVYRFPFLFSITVERLVFSSSQCHLQIHLYFVVIRLRLRFFKRFRFGVIFVFPILCVCEKYFLAHPRHWFINIGQEALRLSMSRGHRTFKNSSIIFSSLVLSIGGFLTFLFIFGSSIFSFLIYIAKYAM